MNDGMRRLCSRRPRRDDSPPRIVSEARRFIETTRGEGDVKLVFLSDGRKSRSSSDSRSGVTSSMSRSDETTETSSVTSLGSSQLQGPEESSSRVSLWKGKSFHGIFEMLCSDNARRCGNGWMENAGGKCKDEGGLRRSPNVGIAAVSASRKSTKAGADWRLSRNLQSASLSSVEQAPMLRLQMRCLIGSTGSFERDSVCGAGA